jgi:2,3-bisphosphoglycerate-dependent phosphoglycerate mutase
VTELLIARHGETDWNRERRWQGHSDPPLNDLGRAQARELAAALADEGLEAIYASDLRRATETAEIVGGELGLPVTSDPALREIDVGSWSGLTREELEGRPYDGESKEAHGERVLQAVRRLVRAYPNGRVLVVTHGGSVRRIQEVVHGEAAGVLANCEVLRLPYQLLH